MSAVPPLPRGDSEPAQLLNAALLACARAGDVHVALHLFREARARSPAVVYGATVNLLLLACANAR